MLKFLSTCPQRSCINTVTCVGSSIILPHVESHTHKEAPRHNDFRWVGCPRVSRGGAYRNPHRRLSPTGMPQTRRSALSQSSTLYVGMDGHKESIAVASVATD